MSLLQIIADKSAAMSGGIATTLSLLLALLGAMFLLAVLVTVAEGSPVKKAGGTVVSGFFFVASVMFNGYANDPAAHITQIYHRTFAVTAAITIMTAIIALSLMLVGVIEYFNRDHHYVIRGAAAQAVGRVAFNVVSDRNTSAYGRMPAKEFVNDLGFRKPVYA